MFLPTAELVVRRLRPAAVTAGAIVAGLLVLIAPARAQQTGSILGRVTSSGQPVSGVIVQVVGTEFNGATSGEGRFTIAGVPAGTYDVTATSIGYGQATQEATVPAGGQVVLEFSLQSRAVELEGIVVTGTAINAQKKEIGNSIDLITAADIEAAGATSVEAILRGRVEGLAVSGSVAQPGAGANINIRGLTSINGRVSPLIYVDGVRVGTENGAFDDAGGDDGAVTVLGSISAQDIARIEIIKGAAATTLYGTDATAGVIQIFTKRGQPGERARWTFSTQTSLVTPSHVGPGEDIDPTGLHLNRCDINGPLPQDTVPGPDPDCPSSGSWLKNAWSQDYNLQVRGGTDVFTYFASGGFQREDGIINVPDNVDPARADNVFLRANFGFDPVPSLQLQVNNSFTNRYITSIPDGGSDRGLIYNVARLADGETPDDHDAGVFLQLEDQTVDQFTSSLSANWSPSGNMRHRLNVGFDWSNSNRRNELKREHFDDEDGQRTVDIETNRVITLDYAGSYLWTLPWFDAYQFTTSWGGQLNDRQSSGLRGDSDEFINRGRTTLEQGVNITNLNEDRSAFINGGFFVQQQIGWSNMIFLTGGLRVDSYNTIDELLNSVPEYQVFPRLQGTYTMSDHSWWPTDIIETFRLRAAFGVAGDPPPQVASRTLWDIRQTGRGNVGYTVNDVGNPNVGPERTSEWEAGLDASFLAGRINFSGQYFQRHTRDGLIDNDPIPSQGIIEPQPFNAGDWKTWGFEATLDMNVLDLDGFRWNVNTTYEYVDNEMLSIGIDEDGSFNLGSGVGTSRFREGYPFPGIFDEKILNPDAVGELPVYTDSAVFLGVNIPPQEISVNTSFSIGERLNIDLFGYGQFGHVLLDGQAVDAASDRLWPGCEDVFMAMDAWREAGRPDDGVPQFRAKEIALCDDGDYANVRDWYDEGDFFRFSSASVRYNIPESWLPSQLTGATLQFRVLNLSLFTDFNGTDPDAIRDSGVQQVFRETGFIMPLPRTYALNLRLHF